MTARRTPVADVPGRASETSTMVSKTRGHLAAVLFTVCCVLVLTGCKSGTLTGSQQSCASTGSLFADKRVACTGSVAGVRGEPSVGIIDTDQDLSGTYKLDAIITVGKGTAKAYVDTADGGKASPDEPLHIGAVVELDEADEEVDVNLKVLGKEVRDLRYKATLLPQD